MPRPVACLLLYVTLWGAPPSRVLDCSSWAKGAMKRYRRAIMQGKARPEDLFENWPPRPNLHLAPEVAILTVQHYLRRLPGHLLTDGPAWHSLGHDLLALGANPWHHHVPCVLLARVKALRAAMGPAHNLLLDMVVASMRTSGGRQAQDVMAAARFWAVAVVRAPGPGHCMECAYLHEDVSSLGVAHALYYLARWGLLLHPHPFTHVLGGGAAGSTHAAATTTLTPHCDLCGQGHDLPEGI